MKKNVILDLDNTILSAEAHEDFPYGKEGIKEKVLQFDWSNMDDYYIVFERPLVQEFLDWLFEHYNVSVWTAASKDYALYVIDHIILTKPNRKLNHIMFSHHCKLSEKKYNYSKQLKLIFDDFKIKGYHCDNTLIIDDLKEVHTCQPKNSIHIPAFEILNEGSENDTELENTKQQIKKVFAKLEKK